CVARVEKQERSLSHVSPTLALSLGGGGARAAYQVGVLRALAQTFPQLRIPIFTGVSAGAINIAFLANGRGELKDNVERAATLWKALTPNRIFKTDAIALATNVLGWGVRLVSGGAHLTPPMRGLVDTRPLRRFLSRALETREGKLLGIAENIR